MRETTIRVFLVRCCCVAACGALLTVMTGDAATDGERAIRRNPVIGIGGDSRSCGGLGWGASRASGQRQEHAVDRRQLSRAERASPGASGRLR